MQWLVALLAAVSSDPRVQTAARQLLRALVLAAVSALGLGALLLVPGIPLSGS